MYFQSKRSGYPTMYPLMKGITVMAKSREQLIEYDIDDLKASVEKDSWITLKQYFDGKGNGPAAKVACVVIGTLAKEQQSKNNARQLDIIERRLLGIPPIHHAIDQTK
jgi:hypothetical protein